jgi:N-carbamoyl-L-amino-acid hydrolase
MECRHPDEATLTRMEADLLALAETCASAHGLSLTHQRVIHMPAAPMDARMMAAIEEACRRAGVGRHTRLVSYAGHDAQMMSDFTPSGMIFIPSVNGISHNPKEFTAWPDVVAGVNVLLHTTLALIDGAANT